MEKWSKEWKEDQLFQLYGLWKNCKECPLSETRSNVVFGMGNPDAKVLIIGEAPGADEDASGKPFVGESGKLLRALMTRAGFTWDSLFVTNIVACRPPANRDPSTIERDACLKRVYEIIYIVDPMLVVPVGKFSLKALAKGRDWSIVESRGSVFSSPTPDFKLVGDKNGLEVPGKVFPRTGDDKRKYNLEYDMIPILHPAYLLREDGFDEKKKAFAPGGLTHKTLADLAKVKSYLDAIDAEYALLPKAFAR